MVNFCAILSPKQQGYSWLGSFLWDSLTNKNQAIIWVADMKLTHAVVAVNEIANPVFFLEVAHMLPKRCDICDLDIDFGMTADCLHDLFASGLHEMNSGAVSANDGIARRPERHFE